jgi:hypothetical protein
VFDTRVSDAPCVRSLLNVPHDPNPKEHHVNATLTPAPAGMTVTVDDEARPVVALALKPGANLSLSILPVYVSAAGALLVAPHDAPVVTA